MQLKRFTQMFLFTVLTVVGGLVLAADHLDAPLTKLNHQADINDVYAFLNPDDNSQLILVMTVNPLAGEVSPTELSSEVNYDFLIDNNGDFERDMRIRVRLAENGEVKVAGPHSRVFSGLRDDPFFFDLNGFRNGLNFTGSDFFAGKNITAIVVEVAAAELATNGSVLRLWAETSERGRRDEDELGQARQNLDRMGNPAINTVFIPAASKDAFNQGKPKDDPANFNQFIDAFSPNLRFLLPDVMTIDISKPSGFLNGRRLEDDVIDIELGAIKNVGGVNVPTTDNVNANDKTFLSDWPFLAEPH